MELHTTFTLIPIKCSSFSGKSRFDMIQLNDQDNFPTALVHVDTFHSQTGKDLYNALYVEGKTLKVKVTLEVIEEQPA